jgi:hypothetical protein
MFLTRREVAQLCRLSDLDTVSQMARDGRLPPAIKVGTRLLWDRRAVLEKLRPAGGL